MFRIRKVFENSAVEILRVEGKITEETLPDWKIQMQAIKLTNSNRVILDFAQVWFMSSEAIDVLMKLAQEPIYFLNCGMELRNVLHASGLSAKVLE